MGALLFLCAYILALHFFIVLFMRCIFVHRSVNQKHPAHNE